MRIPGYRSLLSKIQYYNTPHINNYCNQFEKEWKYGFLSCETLVITDGLLNPLGRYLPTFYRDGKASSILLIVKVEPPTILLLITYMQVIPLRC